MASQVLARSYSIYVSSLAYTCHALEVVPAPPLHHVASPWSVGRKAWKTLCPWLRGSAGEARRAGVCDPPTLMVPLPFLKLYPRSHAMCGQTEKLALELIAPFPELHLLKVNESLGGNGAGGAQLRLTYKKGQSFSQSKATPERMDWIVPAGKEETHTARRVRVARAVMKRGSAKDLGWKVSLEVHSPAPSSKDG